MTVSLSPEERSRNRLFIMTSRPMLDGGLHYLYEPHHDALLNVVLEGVAQSSDLETFFGTFPLSWFRQLSSAEEYRWHAMKEHNASMSYAAMRRDKALCQALARKQPAKAEPAPLDNLW